MSGVYWGKESDRISSSTNVDRPDDRALVLPTFLHVVIRLVGDCEDVRRVGRLDSVVILVGDLWHNTHDLREGIMW